MVHMCIKGPQRDITKDHASLLQKLIKYRGRKVHAIKFVHKDPAELNSLV